MKFVSSTSALLKQLQAISGAISTKNVIHILEYFLFELEDGQLTVTATDLEISMRSSLNVEGRENGKVAVPSKQIVDLLKTLPEQPVTFIIGENNNVEIISDSGKYKIAGQSAEDYPKFPEVGSPNSIELPATVLNEAINTTSFSIGTDELRPAMTGLLVQMEEEELRFVATDGNKLVLYSRSDVRTGSNDSFIMPRKALGLLRNSLPDGDVPVVLEYNRLNAHFIFGNLHLVCRLIDERFPDYKAAIPSDSPNRLAINRELMLGALRRMVIFTNKTTFQVRLKLAGSELQISAQDIDYAHEGSERLPCEYDGKDLEIGFNAKYLIDMLTSLSSEEVNLNMSEYNRPGILRPAERQDNEEILMLLMPIVLNY